jgi:hypothetical protein
MADTQEEIKRHNENAAAALAHYDEKGEEATDITDLLTDLMHLCQNKDWDFQSCLSSALDHYEEESGDKVV